MEDLYEMVHDMNLRMEARFYQMALKIREVGLRKGKDIAVPDCLIPSRRAREPIQMEKQAFQLTVTPETESTELAPEQSTAKEANMDLIPLDYVIEPPEEFRDELEEFWACSEGARGFSEEKTSDDDPEELTCPGYANANSSEATLRNISVGVNRHVLPEVGESALESSASEPTRSFVAAVIGQESSKKRLCVFMVFVIAALLLQQFLGGSALTIREASELWEKRSDFQRHHNGIPDWAQSLILLLPEETMYAPTLWFRVLMSIGRGSLDYIRV